MSGQPPPARRRKHTLRQIQPALPTLASSSSSTGGDTPNQQPPSFSLLARRRPVTAACEQCRRRKRRCDAKRPSCLTCLNAGVECVYLGAEGVTRHAAQQKQLEDTSVANNNLHKVVDLLRCGKEEEVGAVLRYIREAQSVEDAVQSIADASLLLPFAESASKPSEIPSVPSPGPFRPPPTRRIQSSLDSPDRTFEGLFRRTSQRSENSDGIFFIDPTTTFIPYSKWTSVSDDDQFLNHLVTLFFTWDPYLTRVFHRPLFLEDAEKGPGEDRRYCSEALVNAVLALGCIYSTQEATCADPNNLDTRGQLFMQEAWRLLESTEGEDSYLSLQAQIILWAYDALLGDGAVSARVLPKCVALHTRLTKALLSEKMVPSPGGREDTEQQARAHMLWGFYSLINLETTIAIGGPIPLSRPPKPNRAMQSDSPDDYWFAYPISLEVHNAHTAQVWAARDELMDLVMEINALRDHVRRNSASTSVAVFESLYDRLCAWKYGLAEELLLLGTELPSVFMLHTAFDVAVMRLLEPLHGLAVPPTAFAGTPPSALRATHAQSVMSIVWAHRARYTVTFKYWYNAVSLCAAQAILDAATPSGSPSAPTAAAAASPAHVDSLLQILTVLREMGALFPVSRQTMVTIRALLVTARGLTLPPSVARRVSGLESWRVPHSFVDTMLVSTTSGGVERREMKIIELIDQVSRMHIGPDL